MNNPKSYIVELARSFPCLRQIVSPDSERWDVQSFLARSQGMSSGELHAVAFVASVWNGNDAARRFNAMEALKYWDEECRVAFLAWASNPRWP